MTAAMLANHIWQSTIVAGVAWLITIALRRNHAGARYAVWLAASLKFLVPFALLVSAGRYGEWRPVDIPAPPHMAIVMESLGEPFSAPLADGLRAMAPAPRYPIGLSVPAAGAALWLTGVVAMLITWCVRWRRVSAIVSAGAPAREGPVVDAVRRLEGIAAVKRRLAIVVSDAPLEPGVFGIVRPVLLWPRRMSEHLDDSQIEAILAHELSHLRRRDNLAAAAHMIVQAIFWFYPLVWWLGARLVDERERACDEDVVRLGNDPRTYAESILKTCQFFVGPALACVAGVTGSDLKKRIEHIMIGDSPATLGAWKKTLLALAAGGVIVAPVGVGVLNAQRLGAQTVVDNERVALQKEIQTRLTELHDAMRSQLAGVTDAPLAFEVASIKRNTSAGPSRARVQPGGRYTAVGVPVVTLIRQAYDVLPSQVLNAPEWMSSERYDILAKAPDGAESFNALAPLLRSLLRDRFGFKAHAETREMAVFELVLARRDGKLGPKLEPSTVDCTAGMPAPVNVAGQDGRRGAATAPPPDEPPCSQMGTPGRRVMRGFPIGQLTRMLGAEVNRPVINRTGLTGTWNLEVEFASEQMANIPADALPPGVTLPSADAPSIFTALQEQLGLKLEPAKGPVEVLVIDNLQKPTED